MISEGNVDTEDRSNDAENLALHIGINCILTYIKIENILIINCNNISQYYNKCSLGEHKIFKKSLKIIPTPNFWKVY